MASSVFNKDKDLDFTKQPMFLVKTYGTKIRQYEVSIFDKLTQQQLGFFLRTEEVSLQKTVRLVIIDQNKVYIYK